MFALNFWSSKRDQRSPQAATNLNPILCCLLVLILRTFRESFAQKARSTYLVSGSSNRSPSKAFSEKNSISSILVIRPTYIMVGGALINGIPIKPTESIRPKQDHRRHLNHPCCNQNSHPWLPVWATGGILSFQPISRKCYCHYTNIHTYILLS